MAQKLGRMKRISDLRSVWAHEANDFTKWLAEEENLSELSDSLGIEIDLEERESSVGSFNVDIFATESGTGRKIIIENQLEYTNHDHLGKLITYAAGKGAEVIIWIVKKARDEHRQAIEWLNQHTDANVGFFLVEIELWQIDQSNYAPKFNVVEKPNDFAKSMKEVEGLSEGQKKKLEFWQFFNDTMEKNVEFNKYFRLRKPQPHHWYDLGLGTSAYFISMNAQTTKRKIDTGICIRDNKELFHLFKEHKEEFEKALGGKVIFREASKASRLIFERNLDITEEKNREEAVNWLFEKSLIFKQMAKKIDK